MTSRHEKVCRKCHYKFLMCEPSSAVGVVQGVQHVAVCHSHVEEVKERPPPPLYHAVSKTVVGEELLGHVNSCHVLVVVNDCNWLLHLLSSSRSPPIPLNYRNIIIVDGCQDGDWPLVRPMDGHHGLLHSSRLSLSFLYRLLEGRWNATTVGAKSAAGSKTTSTQDSKQCRGGVKIIHVHTVPLISYLFHQFHHHSMSHPHFTTTERFISS